jgi:hypothetical protein
MIRKLIALLVLVTGLAAAGQPAQARVADFNRIGLASLSAPSACSTQAGAHAASFRGALQRGDIRPRACPKPPRIVLVVPTVMLQIDRARE